MAHRIAGRRPTKVAAIALANKIARMVWAMMAVHHLVFVLREGRKSTKMRSSWSHPGYPG